MAWHQMVLLPMFDGLFLDPRQRGYLVYDVIIKIESMNEMQIPNLSFSFVFPAGNASKRIRDP